MKKDIIFSWSSGKDSALALYRLQQNKRYNIKSLFTTVTDGYDRVSMHGVRNSLLCLQAQSLGYNLERIVISKKSSNREYERKLGVFLSRHKEAGVNSVGTGDIFLEDLRRYREERLSLLGMKAVFPLWKKDTLKLAKYFIARGFRAKIACVDTRVLDASFAGREFDAGFIGDLPPGVDPCGEKGEFHSFVYDGPSFAEPIRCKLGKKVLRNGRFFYCDILPL